jgi:hypothetical protein
MHSVRSRHGAATVVRWTTIGVFACAAAVVSHVAIDGIANLVVAHDPFDDVGHASRSWLALCIVAMLAVVAGCTLISVLAETRGRTTAFERVMSSAASLGVWRLGAAIGPLSLGLLLLMETADSAVAGVRIDDLGDLLGGSVPLGLAITACVAIAAAFGARRLLAALARAHRAVVVAVARLARVPMRRSAVVHLRKANNAQSAGSISVLAVRAGKRAPPLLTA